MYPTCVSSKLCEFIRITTVTAKSMQISATLVNSCNVHDSGRMQTNIAIKQKLAHHGVKSSDKELFNAAENN